MDIEDIDNSIADGLEQPEEGFICRNSEFEVFSWQEKFQLHYWGKIKSWWQVLRAWLEERITQFKEIVLLDARHEGGRELIKTIHEVLLNTMDIDGLDNGLVAVSVANDDTIAKIDRHEAEVEQLDQYDEMQQKNNGILRING